MANSRSTWSRSITFVLAACAMVGFAPGLNPVDAQKPPADGEKTKGDQLPQHLRERVAARDVTRLVAQLKGVSRRGVLASASKLWPPGSRLRICFLGGTPEARKRVARVASEWSKYGNIVLDFGQLKTDDDSRVCAADDASDIRIAFDQKGYWSLVGTDARSVAFAGQATMNFEGFDVASPSDAEMRKTVLHEWGHALGFLHTNQNPGTGCNLHWTDDPGYVPTTDETGSFTLDKDRHRPGIYTVLGGPPNHWAPEQVDLNLKPYLEQADPSFLWFKHDPDSVMHVDFPASMYEEGKGSPCYARKREVLSKGDKISMAVLYPSGIQEDEATKTRINTLLELLELPNLPDDLRESLKAKLQILEHKPGTP